MITHSWTYNFFFLITHYWMYNFQEWVTFWSLIPEYDITARTFSFLSIPQFLCLELRWQVVWWLLTWFGPGFFTKVEAFVAVGLHSQEKKSLRLVRNELRLKKKQNEKDIKLLPRNIQYCIKYSCDFEYDVHSMVVY